MSSINYDLKKIKGVAFDVDGVLSPSTIPTSPEGEPLRMVNIKDGYALQLAVKCGLEIAIITGATSRGVAARYSALGIKEIHQGASRKVEVLTDWMARYGLTPDEVAFVGDDVPDFEPMQCVGLSVAPADSAIDILQHCRYVSPCNGGYGVARDLLEQILRAQDHWMTTEKAFGW